jgi:Fe-S-cluster containining protein
VIFANVQRQPGDDPKRLQALRWGGRRARLRFLQPCSAFDGCRCRIYSERPVYCREFECLLLKDVNAGRVKPIEAAKRIQEALRRAERVRRLLRELGNHDEDTALHERFLHVQKHIDGTNKADAEVFGRLTLAMHRLHVMLSESFYRDAA